MIKRYSDVPQSNLVRFPKEELLISKSGNDVRLFIILDGVCYQLGLLETQDVGDLSTATDHGLLSGLTDDDHTQYVLRSIFTTKGDIISYSTAVARLGVGDSNAQLLMPDTSETVGLKWANMAFINDEIVSHNDEMVVI